MIYCCKLFSFTN